MNKRILILLALMALMMDPINLATVRTDLPDGGGGGC
tara:strand:+ start:5714 stop:5824 length:111 start_codon:yes stop_codon:yes gene_type:complete